MFIVDMFIGYKYRTRNRPIPITLFVIDSYGILGVSLMTTYFISILYSYIILILKVK